MNIEEAIEILKDNIKSLEGHTSFRYTNYKKVQAIETLLTAYEKEKEIVDKINKLNIPVDTLIAEFERLENLEDDRDILKKEIEELKTTKKELTERVLRLESDKFWDNVVSKDKIKAKIEPRLKELDEQMKKEWKEYGNSREYQDMEDEWNFLQSLLEKE